MSDLRTRVAATGTPSGVDDGLLAAMAPGNFRYNPRLAKVLTAASREGKLQKGPYMPLILALTLYHGDRHKEYESLGLFLEAKDAANDALSQSPTQKDAADLAIIVGVTEGYIKEISGFQSARNLGPEYPT